MQVFLPILAQVISMGVGDRAEARYVIEQNERFLESSNDTGANIDFTWNWRRTSLSVGYSPSLYVAPLLDEPRNASLYHNAYINGNHRWRRSTLGVGVSVGYGERDLQRELTSARRATPEAPLPQQPQPTPGQATPSTPGAQTPPGGTPTPTAPETPEPTTPALLEIARLGSLGVSANFGHRLGPDTSLGINAGYQLSGGVDDESRAYYPVLPSVSAGASLDYRLDGRNTLVTSLTNAYAWGTEDTTTYLVTLNESWLHRFSRSTNGGVSAGLAYSRTDRPNQPTPHTIYPVGGAGIGYTTRLARGTLSLGASVGTAPVLDLTTAVVDPRLGIGASASWSRDRFSALASYSSSLSLTDGAEGALSSIGTDAGVSYEIGLGFSLSAGVREAWQRFEGVTLVEPTTVFYAGVSWGAATQFNEPRGR